MILFFMIVSRNIKRLSTLLLVTTLSLVSCEKTYGLEAMIGSDTTITISIKQIDTLYQDQSALLKEIQARHQVYDLRSYNGIWSIYFKHGNKVRFSESVFPVIQAGDDQKWSISGFQTTLSIQMDDRGNVRLPALSVDSEGFWTLDSIQTKFSAEKYQTFLREEGNDTLNVRGFLVEDDNLHIYLSNDSSHKYSILREGFYLVPDYWMETLVEKEKLAEQAIQDAEGNCSSFVFFTDTHWGKNMKKSPALIRHVIDFTPFDDVIFGGDVVTSHSTNLVTPMETGKDFQASFSFLGPNFHCLYGNHDNNSDSQPNKSEYHLSEEQVFSFLQSQMTDVVYGNYYNFYYDNPVTKTRVICLDTGRFYYSQFRDKLPDTVSYAIETLSTLPDGWHAIMASHIWCTSKKQSDGTYKQYLDGYITPILSVFDDYNARKAGEYTYNKKNVAYDFSNAGGKIEFCIGGHTHGNFTTASNGGIPVIIVISDYFNTPEKGTNREQSVTLVVTDYKHEKLSLFVVGRGSDRSLEL